MTQTNDTEQLEASIRSIHAMRQERDTLQAERQVLLTDLELTQNALAQQRSIAERAQAERDHYMRQVAELSTVISNTMSLLSDASSRTADSVYRPNGHAPAFDPLALQEGNDPIPSFLTVPQS